MNFVEILAWVQIVVGLGTCGALVFYAGRHSQKQREHSDSITELKQSRKEQWEEINEHSVRIALVEKATGGSWRN